MSDKKDKKPQPESEEPQESALDKLIQEFDDGAESEIDDLDAFLSDDDLDEDDEDYSFLEEDDPETDALLAESQKTGQGGLMVAISALFGVLLLVGIGWVMWMNRDVITDGVTGLTATLQDRFPADETSFLDDFGNGLADNAAPIDPPPVSGQILDLRNLGGAASTIDIADPLQEVDITPQEGQNLFFDFEAISREEDAAGMQETGIIPLPVQEPEPVEAIPATDFPDEPLIDEENINRAAEVMRAQPPVLIQPEPEPEPEPTSAPAVTPRHTAQPDETPAPQEAQATRTRPSPVNNRAEETATRRLNETAALLGRARLAQRQGNMEEARRLYEQIVAMTPDHPIALQALASMPPQATEIPSVQNPAAVMAPRPKIEAANPAQELLQRAILSDQAGDFATAIALYREALSVDAVQFNGQSLDRGLVYDRMSIARERLGQ